MGNKVEQKQIIINGSEVVVCKVAPNEIEALQTIGKQTFYETFVGGNNLENIQNYLEESFHIDKLKNELTNPDSSFYFAKVEDTIVGYLKINFGQAQTEIQDDKALEIERIYVVKHFHGKSVGQILISKALEIARKENLEYVWLGVWGDNARALKFYKKNGFIEFGRHIFRVGNNDQTDLMMKLNLIQ